MRKKIVGKRGLIGAFGKTFILACGAGRLAYGAEAAAPARPPAEQVSEERENWFQKELRRFLGYPHLDRAYRLIRAHKYPEAQAELRQYLDRYPKDRNARHSLMVLLYESRDYPGTIAEADRLLEGQPGEGRALFYRGLAEQALGRREAAAADLLKAAEQPALEESQRRYALSLAADLAAEAKHYDRALQALTRLARLRDDFEVRMRMALVLDRAARPAEAAEQALRAFELAKTPEQKSAALRTRAEAARKSGNFPAAKSALVAALEFEPDDPALLRSLAYTAYATRDLPEAADWAERLVVKRPTHADRKFLGQILFQLGRYRQAAEQLSAVELKELDAAGRFEVLATLGYAYQKLGENRKAADRFEQALAIKRDPEVLQALALNQEKAGRYDEAIEALRKSLAEQPSVDSQLSLGMLLLKEGREQEASQPLRKAYESLPAGKTRTGLAKTLGYFYAREGRLREARQFFEAAAQADPNDADLYAALAQVSARAHDHRAAVAYFEKSLALKPSPATLRELIALHVAAGEWEPAAERSEALLRTRGLPARERSGTLRSLGYLYQKLGKPERAEAAFREALAENPEDPRLREALGHSLLGRGKLEPALGEFEATAGADGNPRTLATLANIEAQRGKPGLAIHYFTGALEHPEAFPPKERAELYRSLGNLYAEEQSYGEAVTAYEESLALGNDAETTLRLGASLRRAGQPEKAVKTLEALPEAGLAPAQRLERQDELAAGYWETGRKDQAFATLSQIVKKDSNARRQHQLGLWLRETGEAGDALPHLKAAHDLEPDNSAYAEDLGYALVEEGDYEAAAPLFEAALAANPTRLRLHEDLGYAYMRTGENEKAIAAFTRAIDERPNVPVHGAAEQAQLDEGTWRLRNEIGKLGNQFDLQVYESYRDNNRTRRLAAGGLAGGTLPSQGGVQLGWQPPVLGFQDEKTLQVFGRLLWSNRPSSLDIDDQSVQAGVGIRYKPLRDYSLYLSAEKLLKIGSQAIDDWLLRTLFGWSTPLLMSPAFTDWNYTSVYTDLGYFIDKDIWAFYGEARQGWTFRVMDWLLLTPHAVIDGRTQTRDVNDISYLEGGGGVSARFLFNETKYETYRSSFELLLQYKASIVNAGSGVVVTGVLNF